MLPDVHNVWLLRSGVGGIEMQSFAGGLHQFPQRLIGGIAAAVFVGGDHRLRSAGPPGQVGLRQTLSASGGPDNQRWLSRASEYRPARYND